MVVLILVVVVIDYLDERRSTFKTLSLQSDGIKTVFFECSDLSRVNTYRIHLRSNAEHDQKKTYTNCIF